MSVEETELDMVRRHVREGVKHIARQRALIARLKINDLPTDDAEALLVSFEETQRQHEAHLVRIGGI